jgi:hypothetical protein
MAVAVLTRDLEMNFFGIEISDAQFDAGMDAAETGQPTSVDDDMAARACALPFGRFTGVDPRRFLFKRRERSPCICYRSRRLPLAA